MKKHLKYLLIIITLITLQLGAVIAIQHYLDARGQYNYELALDVAEGAQP